MALIAWYKLDENTNDSVGLSPITVTTPFTYTTGKFGQAGIGSGYWPAATTASILNNNALSFSFWIYVTGNGGPGVIFGNEPMTPPNNRKFTFFQYPRINDLHLSWQNDDTGTFIGGAWYGVFPTGQWTHCAITYNNPTCKIYINGSLIYTGSGVSNSASFAFNTNVFYNSTSRYIDDFKVYTHALNESEIKRLAGTSRSLVAHYKFDGNGEDVAGRYNASLTSTTFSAGVFKQGLDFNATGNVDFGNLNLGKIFSISFWAFTRDISYPRTNLAMQKSNGRVYDGSNSGWDIGHGYKSNGFDIAVSDGTNFKRGTLVFDAGYRPSEYINKWVHTVFIIDSDSKIVKAYVNGIKQTNEFNFSNVTGSLENTGTVKMGNLYGWRLNGIYDDIRFYNYALDESKIKDLALPKILHYKFDSDYEEATQNYIHHQNPRIDASYAPYVATTSGTWQAKHPDAIRVYNQNGSEITGYINSGVTDWTNTYHAIWTFDNQLGKPVVTMRDIDGIWKSKSFGIGQTFTSLGLNYGDKYTISWLQWVDNISKRLRVGVYGQNTTGTWGFYDGQGYPSNTETGRWERVSWTFTVATDWNLSSSLNIYMYGMYDVRATIKIADVQFETKDHASGFVNGPTRTGAIVKDHSLAENHGIVDLTYTPKWTKSDISYGLMDFNYTKQHYISVPDFIPENKQAITIMAWIKSNDITKSQNIFSRNGPFFMRITSSTLRLGFYTGTWVFVNGATTLQSNKWYHLAITYDGIKAKGYVNGILDIDVAKTGDLLSWASDIRVGYTTGGEDAPMDGKIDELKVYYKALSQEEIQNEMNSDSKQIYYDKSLTESKITMEPNKGSMEF